MKIWDESTGTWVESKLPKWLHDRNGNHDKEVFKRKRTAHLWDAKGYRKARRKAEIPR
jgi:hypothetical protein